MDQQIQPTLSKGTVYVCKIHIMFFTKTIWLVSKVHKVFSMQLSHIISYYPHLKFLGKNTIMLLNYIIHVTNSMANGTQRFNVTLTRPLQ